MRIEMRKRKRESTVKLTKRKWCEKIINISEIGIFITERNWREESRDKVKNIGSNRDLIFGKSYKTK